jgi:hypothetical protein
MKPLLGVALPHAEQPPLYDLERVGLQGDQDQQQPILWRGQRTVLIGRLPTGGAWSPIEAPVSHMGLERGLKRRHQRLKLLHGETGHIEHLCGAALEIGKPSSSHGSGLRSSEAEHTINRDELYYKRD